MKTFSLSSTAIDEVPDAEEPVEVRIERDRAQGALKGAEAAVHIADDEVAARLVEDERGCVHAGISLPGSESSSGNEMGAALLRRRPKGASVSGTARAT